MLQTTFLGLFFGTIGTTIGGLIGIISKRNSNKFLSFILSFSSGLMLAVVCFSLIPEALEITSVKMVIASMILGIITMIICHSLVKNKFNEKTINNGKKANVKLLRTGIMVGIGLAIHNIPEGLAIGSGFDASQTLGFSVAIAICMHDIPEGLSMALPMKNGGMSALKVMTYVILSGVATGIGALIGAVIGNISLEIIAICLSFAAGAMLYIVSGELIPEYNDLYKGRLSSLGNMAGFVIGLIAMIIC